MSTDPNYPKTQKTVTRKYDSDTGVYYYEASHGDMPGAFSDKMEQCWSCGMDWPLEEVVYWRGRPFCPDCKSDIRRLILRESDHRVHSDGQEQAGGTDFSDIVP